MKNLYVGRETIINVDEIMSTMRPEDRLDDELPITVYYRSGYSEVWSESLFKSVVRFIKKQQTIEHKSAENIQE
jgi:hypothetical protein